MPSRRTSMPSSSRPPRSGSGYSSRSSRGQYAGGRNSYGGPSRSSYGAPGSEPLRSVRVGDVRASSRRQNSGVSGFMKVLIVVVALLAVLGIGGAVLYFSNALPVSKVTVSGVEHLTAEEMTELAAVPQDATLLRVDTAAIEDNLKTNAWVQEVKVERVFPDTINLNITERKIAAVVEVTVDNSQTTQTWALGQDGMWLMQIPDRNSEEGQQTAEKVYLDAEAALTITGVPYGTAPEAGTMCSHDNVTNALSVLGSMTTELADRVVGVDAASSDSTTLILDNGIEVVFGDSSDIREKERVVLSLMEKYPNQISYINVRVVNKPVWRSI